MAKSRWDVTFAVLRHSKENLLYFLDTAKSPLEYASVPRTTSGFAKSSAKTIPVYEEEWEQSVWLFLLICRNLCAHLVPWRKGITMQDVEVKRRSCRV